MKHHNLHYLSPTVRAVLIKRLNELQTVAEQLESTLIDNTSEQRAIQAELNGADTLAPRTPKHKIAHKIAKLKAVSKRKGRQPWTAAHRAKFMETAAKKRAAKQPTVEGVDRLALAEE